MKESLKAQINFKNEVKKVMHNLEINRGRIFIDGFEIKNVTGYNLKSSGKKGIAELELRLIVNNSKAILNHCTNYIDSDFSQSVK